MPAETGVQIITQLCLKGPRNHAVLSIMNKSWKTRLGQLSDLPFLILFTIYLTYTIFTSTTFHLPVPDRFLKNLFFLFCLSMVLRFPVYLKALLTQKRILAASILLALNYVLVYRSGNHLPLLFSGILTVGFLGMDHRKVLKLFTIVLGCLLVLTFSAACCGAIQDFVMMKDGYVRTSLGICYPTDMASYVLFLLMYSWAAWKRIPDLVAFILGVACFFFSRYIAMSITSTICSAVFCAVVLGHFLCVECGIVKRVPPFLRSLIRQLMTFAFPLLALLMFVLMFAYSKNIGPAVRLNSLLSDRLALPLDAFRKYGLKPFGTPFEQVGNGFSSFAPKNYYFVDSTYPLILIRYGWILFLSLCASWSMTTRKAFQSHNTRLACVLAMIAFHSFSEHHFIETNFNVLALLPFAAFLPDSSASERSVSKEIRKSALITLGLAAASGFAALLLPVFFTWMRTVFQLNKWTSGGANGFRVLRTLAMIYGSALLAVTGLIFCVYILRSGKVKAPKLKAAAAVLVCAVSLWDLYSIVQAGNALINNSVSKYSEQLEADRAAIQLIADSASGKVYMDSFPCMYQQKINGISDSLLLGDELARFYNTSVIMDVKYDSNCFINSGFLFTPISNRYGLYTNDIAVISALKEHGFHLTGYYNVKKSVSLKSLARLNQLSYTKEAGLSLSGNDQALKKGPTVSLYNGTYTVEYELNLLEKMQDAAKSTAEDIIATLRVSAFNGEKLLKEHIVKRNQFDQNGHATLKLTFYSNSYPGIEFLAIPEQYSAFTISSISYYRSPEYDVHMFYNQKRQKYKEEYYTLDGTPTETAEGYNACEFEYDYDGRITGIHYYDSEDHPVLISGGYASLKRVLDQKGRIVLESYFGTDGDPTLCTGGYAAISRTYNQNNDVIVQKFFDTSGNLTPTISLYAEVHRTFDQNHHVIQESYYDLNEEPFTLPAGYAKVEYVYDSNGRPYIEKYFDSDGNLVLTNNHYAEIHREYTSQNQISQESYFGIDGKPLSLPNGYAMIKRSFDSNGNAVLIEYCNSEGQRVMTAMNYSALRRKYNNRNHIIYEAYFDVTDNPVLMPEKYAAIAYERNEIGDAVSYKYFDANNKLCNRIEGYAELKQEYNEIRLPVHDSYYDTEGKPVITTMHYSGVRREFNELRQISREYFYDTEDSLMLLPAGYASVSYEKDSMNHPFVFRYYDLLGKPVIITDGYAELHKSYDQKGRVISESYYDTNQNAVENTEGFHRVEYTLNDDGTVKSKQYYNAENILLSFPQ